MFEGSFRQVLRREVDAIPLPAEDEWVPRGASGGVGALALVAGATAVALLLGVVTLSGARIPQSPAAEEPARVTPPARPTVVDGRKISPVPNLYRDLQFNYNLVLPAWFHESQAVAGLPSEPTLLERKIFTARSDADEARFGQFRPWDLFVEVYRREGRSLEEWAGALGCDRSGPVGASTCAVTPTRIRGAEAVVGTRGAPLAGKIYVIDRGDQVLVLRYGIGDESNRPPDVTEATLEEIIRSLGLV